MGLVAVAIAGFELPLGQPQRACVLVLDVSRSMLRAKPSPEACVQAALATLGLPKRDEISALRAPVNGLEARLDALGVAEPVPAEAETDYRGWKIDIAFE